MASTAASRRQASDSLWQQAHARLVQGRLDAARTLLDAMFERGTDETRAHLLDAQVAWREDRISNGARHALDAAQSASDDPGALCASIAVLVETGETVAARHCLAHPALTGGANPLVLIRMAGFRKRLEEHAESLALLGKVQLWDTKLRHCVSGAARN